MDLRTCVRFGPACRSELPGCHDNHQGVRPPRTSCHASSYKALVHGLLTALVSPPYPWAWLHSGEASHGLHPAVTHSGPRALRPCRGLPSAAFGSQPREGLRSLRNPPPAVAPHDREAPAATTSLRREASGPATFCSHRLPGQEAAPTRARDVGDRGRAQLPGHRLCRTVHTRDPPSILAAALETCIRVSRRPTGRYTGAGTQEPEWPWHTAPTAA